jgi:hypothetical protein
MKVYDPGEWEGVVYESGSWCGGKICLFGKNNYLLVCLPFFIRIGFLNTLKMLGVVQTLMELCRMLALDICIFINLSLYRSLKVRKIERFEFYLSRRLLTRANLVLLKEGCWAMGWTLVMCGVWGLWKEKSICFVQ